MALRRLVWGGSSDALTSKMLRGGWCAAQIAPRAASLRAPLAGAGNARLQPGYALMICSVTKPSCKASGEHGCRPAILFCQRGYQPWAPTLPPCLAKLGSASLKLH